MASNVNSSSINTKDVFLSPAEAIARVHQVQEDEKFAKLLVAQESAAYDGNDIIHLGGSISRDPIVQIQMEADAPSAKDVYLSTPEAIARVWQLQEDEKFARQLNAEETLGYDEFNDTINLDGSISPDPIVQILQMEEDAKIAKALNEDLNSDHDDPSSNLDGSVSPNCGINAEVTENSSDVSDVSSHDDSSTDQSSSEASNLSPSLDDDLHTYSDESNLESSNNGDMDEESVGDLISVGSTDEDEGNGLPIDEINKLPKRKYIKPSNNRTRESAGLNDSKLLCEVCFKEYDSNDELRCLPCCHQFHVPCIDTWLKMRNTCPVCRTEVRLG